MSKTDFVEFYKKNLNLKPNEFDELMNVLESKLPQTFRIINTPFYHQVKKRIEKMNSIKKIDFIKDTYFIDKEIEELEKNRDFIVNQTLIGSIQRQEIVSMIPILLMGLKEDHYVLDLCAAPGSKTKQILNFVKGLIVANDQNSKRLNILMTESFKIPNESFIVTQHDASKFPQVVLPNNKKFDRVLCDVPCSSDGTIRKNPGLLKDWTIKKGQGLFDLQYRILKRSIDLVEDDGIIIYSTCSLNPIENECIIQNIVINENLEVVDPETFIDQNLNSKILFRRGFKTWDVGDFKHKNLITKPINEDIGLENCVRMYPHDFNTGGFFIALLRKKNLSNTKKENLKMSKSLFKDLEETESSKILLNYNLDLKINLIRRFNAQNVIYRISDTVRYVIYNNKLKIISAGCKFFEKCNINETGFRIKNTLYDKDLQFDFEMKIKDLKNALISKTLDLEFEKKSVIIKISDLNVFISGYSTGKKIMLYVCNNLQKALLDFTEEDELV